MDRCILRKFQLCTTSILQSPFDSPVFIPLSSLQTIVHGSQPLSIHFASLPTIVQATFHSPVSQPLYRLPSILQFPFTSPAFIPFQGCIFCFYNFCFPTLVPVFNVF